MRRLPVFALALACAALFGCRSDPVLVVPATFERPGALAFVCVRETNAFGVDEDDEVQAIVPFENCRGFPARTDTDERIEPSFDYVVDLLVAQTARGEVGTVDLDRGAVLDLDARVPGFTFRRVGEGPTAIVVRARKPPEALATAPVPRSTTYVASFASRSLAWLPTREFNRQLVTAGDAEGEALLAGGPAALALVERDDAPEGEAVTGFLVAAIPEAGALEVVPLGADDAPLADAADADGIQRLRFPLPVPDAAALEPVPLVDALGEPLVRTGAYRRLCRDQVDARDDVRTPDAAQAQAEAEVVPLGATPAPLDLEVVDLDPGSSAEPPRQLWVADGVLPLVHRYGLGVEADGTPRLDALPPLPTGVPVRSLAVSPPVPSTIPETTDALPEPDLDEAALYGADDEVVFERFLYAIDATDGSVLVVDVSDPGSATFGAVLPVTTEEGEPAARLALRAAADALAVVTNDVLVANGEDFAGDLDGDGDLETLPRGTFIDRAGAILDVGEGSDANAAFDLNWCDSRLDDPRRVGLAADLPGPTNLRGVFLVAALATGELQIVDVHDLDATCRGSFFRDETLRCDVGRDDQGNEVSERDSFAYVARHRPRIGGLISTEDLNLPASPALTLGTSAASVNEDGSGVLGLCLGVVNPDPAVEALGCASPSAPGMGLDPLPLSVLSCPRFMAPVFGETATNTDTNQQAVVPRICATLSPFDRRGETWRAEWQGLIPGTGGGAARFDRPEGTSFVDALFAGQVVVRDESVSHCTRGVLGRENVEVACAEDPAAPECGYGGDRLRIADDPPTPRADASARCEVFYADRDGDRALELEMNIVRSEQGALTVTPATGRDVAERFAECYAPIGEDALAPGQLFESVVLTGDAYVVTGTLTGFLHRVVEGPGGLCTVDLANQPVDENDPTTFRNGRALLNAIYRNPQVAFRITPDPLGEGLGDQSSRLTFTLQDPATDAFVNPDGTAVFSGLSYLPEARRLYAVDANGDRILELSVEPFATRRAID
ncbi:MAG: hypothetical protein AAF447_02560 [Myxococcota bacterium]